jgi:hypothetical protein
VEFVNAPPGGKRKTGYAYQVLQPVVEDAGHAINPVDPIGNVGGLRDTDTPQSGSAVGPSTSTGRKRSATSAAPDSGRRGPVSRKLASAADFSPTHFDEPNSDAPIPPMDSLQDIELSSPHQRSTPPSPMALEQDVPRQSEDPNLVTTPLSSPISQNPLLQREDPMVVQTPSPRRRPHSFRTHDSTAAWAAAEGLQPTHEGFEAPGYVPAPVVGGITYTVRSPKERSPGHLTHPPITQRASVGRKLFPEYGNRQHQQPETVSPSFHLQQQALAQPLGLQAVSSSSRPQQRVMTQTSGQDAATHSLTQPAMQAKANSYLQPATQAHTVRRYELIIFYAHILTHIQSGQHVATHSITQPATQAHTVRRYELIIRIY